MCDYENISVQHELKYEQANNLNQIQNVYTQSKAEIK